MLIFSLLELKFSESFLKVESFAFFCISRKKTKYLFSCIVSFFWLEFELIELCDYKYRDASTFDCILEFEFFLSASVIIANCVAVRKVATRPVLLRSPFEAVWLSVAWHVTRRPRHGISASQWYGLVAQYRLVDGCGACVLPRSRTRVCDNFSRHFYLLLPPQPCSVVPCPFLRVTCASLRPSLAVCLSCYCVRIFRFILSLAYCCSRSSPILLREGFDVSLKLVIRFRQFIALVIYIILKL